MAWKLRRFNCADCGVPWEKRAPAGAEVRCINCAIARSVVNLQQLRARSGPFYQKWAAGIARAGREAEQLAAIGAEIDRMFPDGPG